MDARKRAEIYQRINRIWVDDAAAMPLYQQQDLYGVNRRLSWKARGDELIKGYEMAIRDAK
jgi:ABC-type transport system substrate-binding protein